MNRRIRWLGANLEEVVCVAMMTFMAVLGFANLLTRYLGYALAYTEELLVMMMVWITLLGAAVGFKRGAHLGLMFIRERLPLTAQRWLEASSLCLTVGTMFSVVYLCLKHHIPDEIVLDTRSMALNAPQFIYTLAIPVGGASVIVRAIQASRQTLSRLREMK